MLRKNLKFKNILVLLFIIPLMSNAQDLTGKQIIEKVYYRDDGDDRRGKLTMTLINSRGDQRVREIKQFDKDFGKEDKKIMFFISPADVRNTSFMNWSYDDPAKDDDQ